MAKALNRSPVYLGGLQKRFELPVFEGAAYSDAEPCNLKPQLLDLAVHHFSPARS